MQLVGSQFPHQGLNLGHGIESWPPNLDKATYLCSMATCSYQQETGTPIWLEKLLSPASLKRGSDMED